MSCTGYHFFGMPMTNSTLDELPLQWAGERDEAAVMSFVDRRALWRLARNKSIRSFLATVPSTLVPVRNVVARQVRLATGCRCEVFPELQTLVRLLARVEEEGSSVYLVGRVPSTLQVIEQNVRATFPKLAVVGRATIHRSSLDAVTTAIRKSAPRVVFVGTDYPLVYSWLATRIAELGPTLVVVAPGAARRMAGTAAGLSPGLIVSVLLRPITIVTLLIHRARAARRLKKSAA